MGNQKIKLLKVGELKDGTIRLQSQLLVNTDVADFILEKGTLKNYSYGENGFDFYEINIPYEIVTERKLMAYQSL